MKQRNKTNDTPVPPPVILEAVDDAGPDALIDAIIATALDILEREAQDQQYAPPQKKAA